MAGALASALFGRVGLQRFRPFLEDLQLGQVLDVDRADRAVPPVHNNDIVDVLLFEELEHVDTSLRVVLSVHIGLNSLTLLSWGTEEQKQRWLAPLARGEMLGAFCLTEPHVGSEASGLRTTARRVEGGWRLTGR